MLSWQRHIRQRNYQRVCVVNLLAAIFSDQRIEGFKEKVKETEVSKTVFSHLRVFFLGFALGNPTAHDFCVIGART